ncbi:MAG: serine/threonine protein kinase [Microcoleus anatoxicus]|uniref:protein kinase domain-containing protein n=1 Tax=Microcoleus anatoxicus TaxID=2705319 RepID=UPI00366F5836
MSYCINSHCPHPQNLDRATVCKSCDANLLLKGRYRVFHTLGESLTTRTFLAVDEDQPSQPRCVIQQFFAAETVPDGQKTRNPKFRAPDWALDELGKHPQIPKLLASFELDSRQYLVQEYIEGRNLATQLLEKGVFKEIHIWYILSELLPVLQFVHDHQLIHRDIKPSNIIHRKSSQAVPALGEKESIGGLALVDFGSAIPANSGPLKTATATGAAEYAAPEQIQGQALPSSDIYSLGITCIHLLTGMSPFDLFDIKADSWAWRHYLKVPVSARLGRILDRMVQRETSKRYPTASAILQDIKHGPTSMDLILGQPQWTLGAWAGAVVGLLSLVLGSRFQSPQPQAFTYQEPATIPEIRFNPPPMSDFQPQTSPEPAAVRTLTTLDKNPVWAVAVTPNGRAIVSGNNDGTIRLLHKRHGKVLKVLAGHSGPVWSVAVSPDGRTIASGGADNTIKLWNLYTGKLIRSWEGHKDGVFSVAFSPDGTVIASVGKDKTLKLWQVDDAVELDAFKGLSDRVQSVAFSPDRQTLATGNSDGTIKLWNCQTGELKQTLIGHSDAVWSLAISPDGQTLASGSWDKTVKLWDISPNHESPLPGDSQLPNFTDNSDRLESHDFSWKIKVSHDSLQPKGSLLRTLIGHADRIQSLAFSPNGDKLASSDLSGTIKLWQTNTGEMTGTLKGHATWVELAFNPQDQTLVSGSFDDTIKVWRLSP